jgi:hypothetical protein
MTLHDPGTVGASLYEAKRLSTATAEVELREAGRWFFDNVSTDDEVVMKLNCEGAECELLDHLIASGELSKVDELLIHFDVRKVDGLQDREHTTRRALDATGVPYRAAESILFGRNISEKTSNWLHWYHAPSWQRPAYSILRRAEFAARIALYTARNRHR